MAVNGPPRQFVCRRFRNPEKFTGRNFWETGRYRKVLSYQGSGRLRPQLFLQKSGSGPGPAFIMPVSGGGCGKKEERAGAVLNRGTQATIPSPAGSGGIIFENPAFAARDGTPAMSQKVTPAMLRKTAN